MKELRALEWYFSSNEAKMLYQLEYDALRSLNFSASEIDQIGNLVERVDIDSKTIIDTLSECLKLKCNKFLKKSDIERKLRKRESWSFEYSLLPKGTTKPGNYRHKATVGASIDLDENLRPSAILWMWLPEKESFADVRESLRNSLTPALNIWGCSERGQTYILNSTAISFPSGKMKTLEKIAEEFRKGMQDTLLRQGQFSLLNRAATAARR